MQTGVEACRLTPRRPWSQATGLLVWFGVAGCGISDHVIGSLAGTRASTEDPARASGGQGAEGEAASRAGNSGEDAGDSSGGNVASGGSATAGSGARDATGGSSGAVHAPGTGGSSALLGGGSGTTSHGGTAATGGVTASNSGGSGGATSAGVAGSDDGPDTDCIVRVSPSGADSRQGSSWSFPLMTIGRALAAASDRMNQGTCSAVEIWVAAGTYRPAPAGDRNASFQLSANVALYGGFAGTEAARAERNVAGNETILSGDGGTPDDDSDDNYHVVRGANGATLDGFTVTGGLANGDADSVLGAGMYNVAASPLVANCTFRDNVASAGAGMYNDTSSPTVTNCTFTNNSAEMGDGGGMHNETSSPIVTNCAFAHNDAHYAGGGMSNEYSSPTITNSTFANNSASENGGGIANVSSSPTLTGCTFSDNTAYEGGGMNNASESAATVTNATFIGNYAYLGGGMANFGSSPTVTNSTFTSNVAAGSAMFTGVNAAAGGGMANEASAPVLTNCVFANNTSAETGGAVSNVGSSPSVTNCTFTGNSADSAGGGLYDDAGSSPSVTNSMLWGDTAADGVSEIVDSDTTSSASVSHGIVQGGYQPGTDVSGADPLFVAASTGDLHLTAASPAIDAGDGCAPFVTLTDASGDARWDLGDVPNAGDGLDLGAFEFQGTAGLDTRISSFVCP